MPQIQMTLDKDADRAVYLWKTEYKFATKEEAMNDLLKHVDIPALIKARGRK